jgi:hypothetical protein
MFNRLKIDQITLRPIARGWVCHVAAEGFQATATCRFAICALIKAKRELRRARRWAGK